MEGRRQAIQQSAVVETSTRLEGGSCSPPFYAIWGGSIQSPFRAQGGVAGGIASPPHLYLPVVTTGNPCVHSAQRGPWAIVCCCVPVAFSLTGFSHCPRRGPMLTQGLPWRSAQGDSRLWGLGCRFQASGRSAGTMCVYLIKPI